MTTRLPAATEFACLRHLVDNSEENAKGNGESTVGVKEALWAAARELTEVGRLRVLEKFAKTHPKTAPYVKGIEPARYARCMDTEDLRNGNFTQNAVEGTNPHVPRKGSALEISMEMVDKIGKQLSDKIEALERLEQRNLDAPTALGIFVPRCRDCMEVEATAARKLALHFTDGSKEIIAIMGRGNIPIEVVTWREGERPSCTCDRRELALVPGKPPCRDVIASAFLLKRDYVALVGEVATIAYQVKCLKK
jgi:hypothetical protein